MYQFLFINKLRKLQQGQSMNFNPAVNIMLPSEIVLTPNPIPETSEKLQVSVSILGKYADAPSSAVYAHIFYLLGQGLTNWFQPVIGQEKLFKTKRLYSPVD